MKPVEVTRTLVRLFPDSTRVIAKRFIPGGEPSADGSTRVGRIVSRILALSESEVQATLELTLERFAGRHGNLMSVLEANFTAVEANVSEPNELSIERRLLIGAYFTHEYSVEAAALSNPSMVIAPDQTGLAPKQTRIILSMRSIGEGHLSSIEFRSGVVDESGNVEIDAPSRHLRTARHDAPIYDKHLFRSKLTELNAYCEVAAAVLEPLPDDFTLEQLEAGIRAVNDDHELTGDATHATRTLHWLASSNYESSFEPDSELSERILFPAGPAESNGMEDARFVSFARDDGSTTYFATYTAFDGYQVLPQLIETADFVTFRVATLNGPAARNKGIALFPRMIDGRFAALSRLDNENSFIMFSNNVRFWHDSQLLQEPQAAWELIQLGNCGSPLETEAGWLVITHGVGPLRQYALGAILLDLDDPTLVIGRLPYPLLEPAPDERNGYVPNVVYSCGSVIVGDRLVLPYGFSDVGTRIATLRVDDLLSELTTRH